MRSPNEEQIGKSEKLATGETRLTKNSGISDGTNDEDLLRILLANFPRNDDLSKRKRNGSLDFSLEIRGDWILLTYELVYINDFLTIKTNIIL